MSTAFDVNIGVKQGCPASHHVFCPFLNKVWDLITAQALPFQHTHTLFLAFLANFILLYADDLVLIADSAKQLQ